jgi:hypothetical protein
MSIKLPLPTEDFLNQKIQEKHYLDMQIVEEKKKKGQQIQEEFLTCFKERIEQEGYLLITKVGIQIPFYQDLPPNLYQILPFNDWEEFVLTPEFNEIFTVKVIQYLILGIIIQTK